MPLRQDYVLVEGPVFKPVRAACVNGFTRGFNLIECSQVIPARRLMDGLPFRPLMVRDDKEGPGAGATTCGGRT